MFSKSFRQNEMDGRVCIRKILTMVNWLDSYLLAKESVAVDSTVLTVPSSDAFWLLFHHLGRFQTNQQILLSPIKILLIDIGWTH